MRHIFPWANHDDSSVSKYLIFSEHISDLLLSCETKLLPFHFDMEGL